MKSWSKFLAGLIAAKGLLPSPTLLLTGWLGLFCGVVWAGESGAVDGAGLLERTSRAARELNYKGVFVHQVSGVSMTSRITHRANRPGLEVEKIESMDGPLEEIIRRNDELACYQPDSKTVRIDRRGSGRFFPSLIKGSPTAIMESYRARLGPIERVAGYDCQWLILEPRDAMRYAQALCSELATGLLLRAQLYNQAQVAIEQFMFTQVELGKGAAISEPRSRFENHHGWQHETAVRPAQGYADTGWQVTQLPAGFRKIAEFERNLAGRAQPVSHLIISDGLADISVFIEPGTIPGQVTAAGASTDNPGSYAVRTVSNHQVTVVGDVPLATVQMIADGVTRRTVPVTGSTLPAR